MLVIWVESSSVAGGIKGIWTVEVRGSERDCR